jgi:hypothetical protein
MQLWLERTSRYIRRRLVEGIRNTLAQRGALLLTLLFTLLFLPQAFILIESLGLINAFEVDPGSHIQAMLDVLAHYNMHAGYHSKYYGWTYFFIQYVLLAPLYQFSLIFGLEEETAIYFAIRLVLFAIGLASTLAFYALVQRLFGRQILSLLAGMIYVLAPVTAKFFYFIHPETTGILFIFLGLHALLDFRDSPRDGIIYTAGVFALVLASLSKQIYFLLALPVMVLFFLHFAASNDRGILKTLLSTRMARTLGLTGLGALAVFFIIHPAAFIQFPMFLEYQSTLGGFVHGENASSLREALKLWMELLCKNPGTLILIGLLLPAMAAGCRQYRRTRRIEMLWLAMNAATALAICALILTMNRLFIMTSYLQPVYPLLIINLVALLHWAQQTSRRGGWVLHLAGIYFAVVLTCGFALTTVRLLQQRSDYKASVAWMTHNYLQANLTSGERIVHDQFVAIPEAIKGQACHYWQGCGTDMIEEFAPDVVIFNTEFLVGGKLYAETERLKRYVREHGFQLKTSFNSMYMTDIGHESVTISVFRRPENSAASPHGNTAP